MHGKRVNIDLGVIEAADGLVNNYIEKPSLRYQVSMGAYVYDERTLSFLPPGACQFPDLVLRLLDAGERVAAFQSDADWYDIGTVGEYERASADVERYPEKYGLDPLPHTDHDLIPALETEETLDEVARRRAAGGQRQRAERPAAGTRWVRWRLSSSARSCRASSCLTRSSQITGRSRTRPARRRFAE
jgi:hypothetical protein